MVFSNYAGVSVSAVAASLVPVGGGALRAMTLARQADTCMDGQDAGMKSGRLLQQEGD